MLITFDEFLTRLKFLGKVWRDGAPRDAAYPYWIYTYTNTQRVIASNQTKQIIYEYQVSLFTLGTEKELLPFIKLFDGTPFQDFRGLPGSENDDTVTNFYTYIEVVADDEQ